MSPQQLVEGRMPSLWGRRAEDTVWRRRAPRLACQPQAAASPPALLGCAAPPPQPPARPGLQPRGLRSGKGHAVVCLEGKEERRGRSPKVGLAGLTGNSTTLA